MVGSTKSHLRAFRLTDEVIALIAEAKPPTPPSSPVPQAQLPLNRLERNGKAHAAAPRAERVTAATEADVMDDFRSRRHHADRSRHRPYSFRGITEGFGDGPVPPESIANECHARGGDVAMAEQGRSRRETSADDGCRRQR